MIFIQNRKETKKEHEKKRSIARVAAASFLCSNRIYSKFLQTKQANTRNPFVWDKADNMKTVTSIVVK